MRKEDLTGKTFSYLYVIEDNGGEKVLCRCLLCGAEKEINRESLRRGHSKSCGCLKKITSKENARKLAESKNLTGKIFPGVEVLEKTDQRKGSEIVYKCKCLHCGNIFYTRSGNLTKGDTTSCGCIKIKLLKHNNTKDCIDGTKISIISQKKPRRNNTSGVTGVAPCKNGWGAYICFKGKRYELYHGSDKQIAIKKRKDAEKRLHGRFLEWYAKEYPEKWEEIQKKENKNKCGKG